MDVKALFIIIGLCISDIKVKIPALKPLLKHSRQKEKEGDECNL